MFGLLEGVGCYAVDDVVGQIAAFEQPTQHHLVKMLLNVFADKMLYSDMSIDMEQY